MNPTRRQVGDKVILTEKSFANVSAGRGLFAYPSDDYINKLRAHIGEEATVTMLFPPGYETNITFPNGEIFQVKDHWVESAQRTVKVTFDNGNSLTTDFNGTIEDINAYYLNRRFNLGREEDLMATAVKVELLF